MFDDMENQTTGWNESNFPPALMRMWRICIVFECAAGSLTAIAWFYMAQAPRVDQVAFVALGELSLFLALYLNCRPLTRLRKWILQP
jgi:hypothetical protein